MEEKIVVVYNFEHQGATICRFPFEEGSSPEEVTVKITGTTCANGHKNPLEGEHKFTVAFSDAVDPETGVETGYPVVDGRQVFSNTSILLKGEEILPDDTFRTRKSKLFNGLTVTAQLVLPTLAKREHPESKTCGQCSLWSHEAGVEELEKVTHVYQNGEAQMIKEICAAMSCTHGKPLLTSENVGYCPKNQELSGRDAPACEHFSELKSAPAQEG